MARAVVLLSGGLDSTTCLAWARAQGLACATLAIDYGQRHRVELEAARRVAGVFGVADHREVRVDLRAIGGSALTADIPVPEGRETTPAAGWIPVTYVPARNTVFLAIALGFAEVVGAADLVAGMNAVDYSGYPTAARRSCARSKHWRIWPPAPACRALPTACTRRS